ncbi:putative porin [Nitrobacter hamburgensis X14]|uniref:Porin n=1 Tax=Nitrobacter hamburgensis (strain DSM 10229 / NCIMB 13809 / X14) TaxID=323097 RepID=Q1QJ75_NITHX|nr:porin [Nitrobacter hamburgensis]ABE63722.1 putative porin [Nitrobacter hamburgensis X14]
MKLMKSLFLGSAAGLVAMSGAQAADLPLKAKAVEYVKVCSLYGAGFYYIPGTDTCIKLGGYIRTDMGINTNSIYRGNTDGAGGAQNRFSNAFTWRSRADLNIDTRTATEYGVVRTYMETVFSWTSGGYAGSATGATTYNGNPNGAVSGGQLGVYFAFIQFAGFTMGKAVSQFSAPWTEFPGKNIYTGLVGGGGTNTGVNQFTYTAEFGNGVSASVGVQDPSAYYQPGILNLATATAGNFGYGASAYGGTTAPDVVGQLRVDQAWGLFQASVAAHNNNPAYYGATQNTGGPGDKWGWAGQLALSIKNIPTGPGDTINIQGVYTNGATRYNIQDQASPAGGSTVFTGVTGVGFGFAPDSVFDTDGQLQLVSTWGIRGGFNHNWNPYWSSSVFGGYASVRYTGAAKTAMCGVGGTVRTALGTGITTCNPDYNIGQIGANLRWTPVKNLTFTTEAVYSMLDQKYAGVAHLAANNGIGKPGDDYTLKDQNTWTVMLRAQRNW